MIEAKALIEALQAYRKALIDKGHTAKAATVAHCIDVVRRMMSG